MSTDFQDLVEKLRRPLPSAAPPSGHDFSDLVEKLRTPAPVASAAPPVTPTSTRAHGDYDGLIQKHAVANNLDPELIHAIIGQESSGNPRAVSPKGARGLMQLMPGTAQRFGVRDVHDPDQNIAGGTQYLKYLLDKFHGDVPLALAGYNAGEGAVEKYGRKIPPYRETQNYVRTIQGRYKGQGYAPQQPVVAPIAPPVDDSRPQLRTSLGLPQPTLQGSRIAAPPVAPVESQPSVSELTRPRRLYRPLTEHEAAREDEFAPAAQEIYNEQQKPNVVSEISDQAAAVNQQRRAQQRDYERRLAAYNQARQEARRAAAPKISAHDLEWHLGVSASEFNSYSPRKRQQVAREVARLRDLDQQLKDQGIPVPTPTLRKQQENRERLTRTQENVRQPDLVEPINTTSQALKLVPGYSFNLLQTGQVRVRPPFQFGEDERARQQLRAQVRQQVVAERAGLANRAQYGPESQQVLTGGNYYGGPQEEARIAAETERRASQIEQQQARDVAAKSRLTPEQQAEDIADVQKSAAYGNVPRGLDTGFERFLAGLDDLGAGAARMLGASGVKESLETSAYRRRARAGEIEERAPLSTAGRAASLAAEVIPGVIPAGAATATAGPVAGFAALSALTAAGQGKAPSEIIGEGIKGGAIGAVFRSSHNQALFPKVATVGLSTAAIEKAFGSSDEENRNASLTNALFAAFTGKYSVQGVLKKLPSAIRIWRNGRVEAEVHNDPQGTVRVLPPSTAEYTRRPAPNFVDVEVTGRAGDGSLKYEPRGTSEQPPVLGRRLGDAGRTTAEKYGVATPLNERGQPAESSTALERRPPQNQWRVENRDGKWVAVSPDNFRDAKEYPNTRGGYAQAIERMRTLADAELKGERNLKVGKILPTPPVVERTSQATEPTVSRVATMERPSTAEAEAAFIPEVAAPIAKVEPRQWRHRDFGTVTEAENQAGVSRGNVRVTDEQGTEHIIQKSDGRGRGNMIAVPVRKKEDETSSAAIADAVPVGNPVTPPIARVARPESKESEGTGAAAPIDRAEINNELSRLVDEDRNLRRSIPVLQQQLQNNHPPDVRANFQRNLEQAVNRREEIAARSFVLNNELKRASSVEQPKDVGEHEAISLSSGLQKSDEVSAAPTKEPWQMSRDEYADWVRTQSEQGRQAQLAELDDFLSGKKPLPFAERPDVAEEYRQIYLKERLHLSNNPSENKSPELLEMSRELSVRRALKAGKPVPKEVLKDYPDLAKQGAEEKPEVGPHGRFSSMLRKSYEHPTGERLPAFLTEPSVRSAVGLPSLDESNAKSSTAMQETADAIAKRMRAPRSSYLGPNGFQRFIEAHQDKLSNNAIDAFHATQLEHERFNQKRDAFLNHKEVDTILAGVIKDGKPQRGDIARLNTLAKEHGISSAAARAVLDEAVSRGQRGTRESDVQSRTRVSPPEVAPAVEKGSPSESSTDQGQGRDGALKRRTLESQLRDKIITRAEFDRKVGLLSAPSAEETARASLRAKLNRRMTGVPVDALPELATLGVSRARRIFESIRRPGFREATPEDRKALRIPPAWTDVQIAVDPHARLIATGRDTKGRTQRLYSAEHAEQSLVQKFLRQREFNTALPDLVDRIERDLNTRSREEASVLRLIALTGFRVGSSADTQARVKAYGASTLRAEHVKIEGDTVHFDFTGKLGVRQQHSITDSILAKDLRERIEKGNDNLFNTNDTKVRNYLHHISGRRAFKVHDFRTWNATEAAIKARDSIEPPSTVDEYWTKRDQVGDVAAQKIGDTRVIALETYIDPLVFDEWRERVGIDERAQRPRQTRKRKAEGDVQGSSEANERLLRDEPLSVQGKTRAEVLASSPSNPADFHLIPEGGQSRASERGALNIGSLLIGQRQTPIADIVTALRRAGLLTGVRTHLRNILSNVAFQASEEAARPFQVLADLAMSTQTRTRTIQGPSPLAVAHSIKDATLKGIPEAWQVLLGRQQVVTGQQLHKVQSGLPLLDVYVNTVFNSLEAEDRIFKIYAIRRSLEEQALSIARTEAKISPSVNVNQRKAQLLAHPTAQMQADAIAYSLYATYQNKNVVSSAVSSLKEKSPAFKFLFEQAVPFDKTPTNIVARILEYSPVGLIQAGVKFHRGRQRVANGTANLITNAIMTPADQKAFAQTFGRGSLGSILLALGILLGLNGLLAGTTEYDEDKDEYFERRRKGIINGSFAIPGTNQRITVPGNPAFNTLVTGATIAEQYTRKVSDEAENEFDVRAGRAATAAFGVLKQQPIVQTFDEYLTTNQTIGTRAGSFFGSYIPTAVSDVGEVLDPEARQAKGFEAQILKRVPPLPVPVLNRTNRRLLPPSPSPISGPDERGNLIRRAFRAVDPFQTTTERSGSRGEFIPSRSSNSNSRGRGERRERGSRRGSR